MHRHHIRSEQMHCGVTLFSPAASHRLSPDVQLVVSKWCSGVTGWRKCTNCVFNYKGIHRIHRDTVIQNKSLFSRH